MTSIEGRTAPSRRADLLGIHSLDHFAISVPDLEPARRFYGDFGLDVAEQGATLQLKARGNSHAWGRITEGKRKALRYLSFGAFADDLPRFEARLKQAGIARIDPPRGVESNGLWFHDCDGTPIEIKAAEKTSPDAKAPFAELSGPAGTRAAATRDQMPVIHPTRMSHALIFSRDLNRSLRFYQETLGLRLSDRTEFVGFLHGVHGSDHHLIAFALSEAPGFHHCSWNVGSINEVGIGAMRMADKGFSEGWGLGRHVLGSNYFHYVRDPWGSFAEYSADIDYIPVGLDWEGRSHAPENSLSLWGPAPPDYFIANSEAV